MSTENSPLPIGFFEKPIKLTHQFKFYEEFRDIYSKDERIAIMENIRFAIYRSWSK